MPSVETKYFETVGYEQEAVIEFPRGLPGFEERRRFVALTFPHTEPLVFLQSLEDRELCFLAAPAQSIDPQFRLGISEEDLKTLRLAPGWQPRIGKDVAALVILTIEERGATANLLAPVVINLANLNAVQAIAADSGYSHRHALEPQSGALCS